MDHDPTLTELEQFNALLQDSNIPLRVTRPSLIEGRDGEVAALRRTDTGDLSPAYLLESNGHLLLFADGGKMAAPAGGTSEYLLRALADFVEKNQDLYTSQLRSES